MHPLRDALRKDPRHITSFINGAFTAPSGVEIPTIDPTTGAIVAILHEADAFEVDHAVTAARAAFRAGWGRSSVAERQIALMAIHDLILVHADELAALETINIGVPYSQTRHGHLTRAAQNFRFFGEFINQDSGEAFAQEKGYLNIVTHEPIGVCGLIGPWNMPIGLTSMKLAAALAFGNCCVVKPSELTPLSLARLFELIGAAKILPDGVINLINGSGAVTGAALSSHADIDMISFTGGTGTGTQILTALARGIKGGAMELGGKSPSIVFEDADLDRALDGLLAGAFMNNGQMCLAGTRIFVHESLAPRLIEAFVARTKALRIGDPFDQRTEIGPMINEAQLARVERYVASGLAEGASLLAGGKRREREEGFFLEPTAMLSTSNKISICQEEIFAPFTTFQVFTSEQEVIDLANDSDFGLVAYVWTQDLERAHRVSRALETGTVLVNTPIMRDLRTGFGGIRQSGLGREGAKGSRAMFTEMKTTVIALERPAHLPRMGIEQ